MRRVPVLLAFAVLFAAPAADAQRAGAPPELPAPSTSEADRQIISVVVYGEDLCPKAVGDEIVVCARKPESERFRIPKDLRPDPMTRGGQAWGSRVAAMDADARTQIPGSCSPNGSYGFTGCARAALDRWAAERLQQKRENAGP